MNGLLSSIEDWSENIGGWVFGIVLIVANIPNTVIKGLTKGIEKGAKMAQ